MSAVGLSKEEYERVFGPKDDLDRQPGRTRLCKTCGGWHLLNRWPHNCMKPQDTPPQILPAPQLAPTFEPFMTGKTDTATYIGSRNDKREYMKRNDLVEYDEGVKHDTVSEREIEREIVQDLKRFEETDPLNIPPDLKVSERVGDLEKSSDSPDVQADNVEIIK
ncbi:MULTISPECIES: hypothetical protein [Halocynthiibacter]|uniref:Uncharacterized protein n=1 Tax=Halocynthiibacter halioticoli TaxID=2986804 RepID=A0AAE3J326_9RHOB|nr:MULTISPECIES: hypothetical protein [Halocynthiibacter]MCV6826010.1 hypothetical protein [Halocynthiibacter halioticoli]MCW4059011.1 hypothetical protein [Halocynthiibacter sp. SDUM655004]